MTYIWTWPRYHQDKNSDKVSWKLKQNYGLNRVNMVLKQFDLLTQFLTQHDPYSIASLMNIGPKLWPLEYSQGFYCDLTKWPSFWPRKIPIRSWPSSMKIGPKLWLLECSEGFSMKWPTDLVFNPTSPIFELDWDIVKMIILSKFDEDWSKTVASSVFTRFFYDLTYWHSVWPRMIHIRSWSSLMKIGPKLWPREWSQGFSMIWPIDLVFDLGWCIFDLD